MLTNDFFTVKYVKEATAGLIFRVALNAAHPIFLAHFAGNPVMPGACMAQMIKELAEDRLYCPFFISTMRNMKFLRTVNPIETPEVSVHLRFTEAADKNVAVSSVISNGEAVFMKAHLVLTPFKHTPVLQQRMDDLRLCVIIPTYNNMKTLAGVIRQVLRQTGNIIVVNDGSTDDTAEILHRFADRITAVSYSPNRGKGYALKCGFDRAEELGYKGAVTIDSDGQHRAADLETFVRHAEKHPGALLLGQRQTVGDRPVKNRFANRFSNLWFAAYTACRFEDTQNGFRLYPLAAMNGLRPFSRRYEAELELLVRSAWTGLKIIPVPACVYYPPAAERVSHFRAGKDFLRISLLNAALFLPAVVYGYPSMLFHRLFTKKNAR